MKNINRIFYIKLFMIPFFAVFLYIGSEALTIKDAKSIRSSVQNIKKTLKKYLLPYAELDKLQKYLTAANIHLDNRNKLAKLILPTALNNDIELKDSMSEIVFMKNTNSINLNRENLILERFEPKGRIFLKGISNDIPGSAYLDKSRENIFILSSTGVLAYAKPGKERIVFSQIENNINNFIGKEQFMKGKGFSTKDLLIYKNKVFVSFTNELHDNCWNISVIEGPLNYKKIEFKPLLMTSECIQSKKNRDNEFEAVQSGGRLVAFDDDHILLSTGDFRSRYLAQDKSSIFGKILRVNLTNKDYRIISMGHRNVQGLYFDKENNFIISTEHGPQGGDEINLLDLNQPYTKEIPNYGWPISSYGIHYTNIKNESIYEIYPLHKSHKSYGFLEPLKYFVPSIGISEIIEISAKRKIYLFSSLKSSSIYILSLNKENEINNYYRIPINERIRDMMIYDSKIILFLEDTASIGVINISNSFKPYPL